MSIFRRTGRMIRARANQAVDRFERPDLLIAAAVADAEKDRNSVYMALHKGMQGVIMTRRQAEEQRRKSTTLRERAEGQLEQGRPELAEQSMRAALLHEYTAEQLSGAIGEMEYQNAGLNEALAQLDSALEVIKAIAMVEQSRYQQALGSQSAAEARYGRPDGSKSAFEQLEAARTKAIGVAASAEATLAIGSVRATGADAAAIPDFGYQARRELGISPNTAMLTPGSDGSTIPVVDTVAEREEA